MEDELFLAGKKYVSSKRAAEMTGYAKDYVGQLCRGKKLDAKLIGRNWYISHESLEKNKKRSLVLNQTIAEAVKKESIKGLSHKKTYPKTTLIDDLTVSFFSDDAPLMPSVSEKKNEPRENTVTLQTKAEPAPLPQKEHPAGSVDVKVVAPAPAKVSGLQINGTSRLPATPLDVRTVAPESKKEELSGANRVSPGPKNVSRMPSLGLTVGVAAIVLVFGALIYQSGQMSYQYTYAEGVSENMDFNEGIASMFSSIF